MEQSRDPRGITTGGRYAATSHPEATRLTLPATTGTVIPDLIELSGEARAVLAAIRSVGGQPLTVGGSVRDALLARAAGTPVEFKDIDLEVRGATLEALLKVMPGEAGLHGESFFVLNTRINGQDFDIALPRRESKTGAGHRGFSVETDSHMSYANSFARRDLTINSMGWDDTTGELIDPYDGLADLDAGILRHTSPAFTDDPLRVLRAVRFAGRFGFDLDPETAELCRSISETFHELPKSRLWGEFSGIALQAPHVSKSLSVLHETGWEAHFPPWPPSAESPKTLRGTPKAPSTSTWA